jgi:hypothetical protein
MRTLKISGFKGIAPRYGDEVPVGMASSCVDVDLSAGKITPRKADSVVQALSTGGNWLTLFDAE